MTSPFFAGVGGVLSADIAVPKHERELRFYSQILTTGENPLWQDDLMNNQGMPIIGLGARTAEHDKLPLQWMPHIQVADIAASVGHALDLGGAELMHGKDVEGNSQWAVLLDPNGAAFGLIPLVPAEALPPAEDGSSQGAPSTMGHINWLDLAVADAPSTCEFYRQVIGWTVQEVEAGVEGAQHTAFHMLGADGRPAAGMRPARGADQGLPPVWMICLPVGDLDESLRRVQESGGKILKATRGAAGEYTYAAVQDPVGACLALVAG